MKIRNYILLTACIATLAACAKNTTEIPAQYVSPESYASYSCAQLREEAARVSNKAAAAFGRQDEQASNDAALTGVSLILFWPAAFFLNGNGENAAEVARLKGEMEAIEQVSVRKSCGITFSAA